MYLLCHAIFSWCLRQKLCLIFLQLLVKMGHNWWSNFFLVVLTLSNSSPHFLFVYVSLYLTFLLEPIISLFFVSQSLIRKTFSSRYISFLFLCPLSVSSSVFRNLTSFCFSRLTDWSLNLAVSGRSSKKGMS